MPAMCTHASTPAIAGGDTVLEQLRASRAAIVSVLATAVEAEAAIDAAGDRLGDMYSGLPSSSQLQSQAVAARALRARIDRAVAPAGPLLAALRRVSALAEEAAAALRRRTRATPGARRRSSAAWTGCATPSRRRWRAGTRP